MVTNFQFGSSGPCTEIYGFEFPVFFDVAARAIGVAQGIALIPGVSRSGVTITTGWLRKMDKESAFTFSFLLFIPAVVGAAILTAVETRNLAAAGIDVTAAFLD